MKYEVYNPKIILNIKDNRSLGQDQFPLPIQNPPEKTRGIRLAMAQMPSNVPSSSEDIRQVLDLNLARAEKAIRLSKGFGAQLIAFPELYFSGYEFGDEDSAPLFRETAHVVVDEYKDKLNGLAKSHKISLIFPSPYFGTDPGGVSGYYDVAFVIGDTGDDLGIYFKNHPWGIAERTWFNIPSYQSPSQAWPVFEINGFPVGVAICYDAEFPETARCLSLNGALLNVMPTAAPDSILPGQTEPYPDIAEHYIPANSLQNQNFCCYVNRAGVEYQNDKAVLTYSGNTVLTTPYGRPLVKAAANEQTLLIADCVHCDYPSTQPPDTDYLINRRPEIYGQLSDHIVKLPYGETYQYPQSPPQAAEPHRPKPGVNCCSGDAWKYDGVCPEN